MSNQLQITGGAKVRSLEGVITGTSGVLGALGINVANGIPQLDSSGKILVSQLPNSVMEYKGTWNVATNTPYLVNGVGNAGDVYIVTGAATGGTSHDFGAGPITFYNGDQAIYDGSAWQRASGSTGSVTSVAMTTPTGLSVTGSPITTSGTLAISLASGYTIPLSTQLVPTGGTTGQILAKNSNTAYDTAWIDNYTEQLRDTVKAAVAINKGQAVYISGANGTNQLVSLASNTSEATSSKTLGLAAQNFAINDIGQIITEGLLSGIDTSTATAGDAVWLGVNGNLIFGLINKPVAPAHLVYIGVVTRVSATVGEIYIKVQNGFELNELHNVLITSPSNGNILQYDGTTSLWKNVAGTTTNIAEGTNLYYTQARFDSAFAAKSTTNLAEGTNLYFTNARAIGSTLTGYVSGAGTITSSDSILTAIQKLNGNVSGLVTGVSSVFGRTGAVVAASGDYTTTQVTEGTNLYFTNARARGAMSANVGSALTYDSATGRYTLLAANSGTSGYLTSTDWNTFNNKQASLGTGTTSQFLRGDLTWATPPTPALDDLTDVTITSPTNGQLLRWQIDHWENWTLPSYVQTTRTLTINGTAYDLSANRTWSVGTITDLTGEATASGTGSVAVTLTNSAVIGKVLTGLNVTGGSVAATDSILTAFGKVQNQINGLIGGSIYKGTWNASTNTPALASSVGTAGWYYIVSVAGSTNLNGITDWNVGDWAIFNGGVWQKVDNTDSVVSVNGFTGAVSLTTDNISEGTTNLYYTNTRARGALSANVGSALTYNSSTGRFTLNAADGTVDGYVTAADYNYWDAKQASLGTGTTSQWLRGDLTWSSVPAPALDDLTDVTITTPSNGQLLRYQAGTWINFTPTYIVAGYLSATAPLSYNSGTGVFSISQATTSTNGYLSSTDWNTFNGKINLTSLSAGTGISYNNTTGVISSTITQYTDANARAAISLTTTGTSGAATYNSTTGVLNIPNYSETTFGTVTSVGLSSATSGVTIGSSPITTSGTITLAIATASGSQQGLLSSTDWTTFNNKQNALTNPVTGTGTTNTLPKFTGTSTIGNSIFTESGGNTLRIIAANAAVRLTGSNEYLLQTVDADGRFRIYDQTAAVERLTISSTGNLGLGATPSAWRSTDKVIQINNGSIYDENGINFWVGQNYYENSAGAYIYLVNSGASAYRQYNGQHQWFNAASGTAGTAISFTQAMTLFANGNLAVGTTTDAGYKLDVNGTGRFSGDVSIIKAGNALLRVQASTTTTPIADIELMRGTNSTWGADAYGDYRLRNSGGDFTIQYGDTGVTSTRLTISSTGAATFASSVTSTSGDVYATDGTRTNYLGVSTGSNIGLLGMTSNHDLRIITNNTQRLLISSTGAATFSSSVTISGGNDLIFRDASTYISSPATDTLRIVTANSERMRITSGGNVLIGTTTDNGSKFQVSGAATFSSSVTAGGSLSGSQGFFTSYIRSNQGAYDGQVVLAKMGGSFYGGGVYFAGDNATSQSGFRIGMKYGSSTSALAFDYSTNTQSYGADPTALTYAESFRIRLSDGAATFSSSVTATGFFESSDKRLKKEISDNPSIQIENVKPKLYIKDGKEELGYYAQDLQEVLPSSVTEGKDGFLSLSYTQVHTAKIASLEREVAELKELIKTLIK